MTRKRQNVLTRIEERMKRIEAEARRREELRNAAKSDSETAAQTTNASLRGLTCKAS
jgi:hypothetical protein